MSVILKGGASGNLADVLGTSLSVTTTPQTAGGLSFYSGQTNAAKTVVKSSTGQLYGYDLYNNNAAQAYVQIFNVASGSVTLGTTVPDMVIVIPANGGRNVSYTAGVAFSTAITYAVTATRTGSGVMTNAVDINFFYK